MIWKNPPDIEHTTQDIIAVKQTHNNEQDQENSRGDFLYPTPYCVHDINLKC